MRSTAELRTVAGKQPGSRPKTRPIFSFVPLRSVCRSFRPLASAGVQKRLDNGLELIFGYFGHMDLGG